MSKPPNASVAAGRDAYLDENGWTLEDYDAKVTKASFFALDISVPNTPRHRWAIMRHDLHHVATGYGTDLVGEAEISAWELRRGLRGLDPYVSALVIGGALMGLVFAPRRTLSAWRSASVDRGSRAQERSLFGSSAAYEDLLALEVAELRARLGVRQDGLADAPRGLHRRAPAKDPRREAIVA
jgi:hypothetical protein